MTQALAQTYLLTPLFEFLKVLYIFTGNFGFAIILFTLILRFILVPLSVPMITSQKKIRDLKPEMDKLKKKHGSDQKKLQAAQMELYKTHNINPLAGCIPQLLQIVVIFALYSVLQGFVTRATAAGISVQTMFFGLDLAKTDPTYIIPILAGVSQLFLSLMLLPGAEHHDIIPDNVTDKALIKENKKETDSQEMAEAMQKQMIFVMPFMTAFFALRFPAGLGLYWIVTTLFSIGQQWVLSGPGGLTLIVEKFRKK